MNRRSLLYAGILLVGVGVHGVCADDVFAFQTPEECAAEWKADGALWQQYYDAFLYPPEGVSSEEMVDHKIAMYDVMIRMIKVKRDWFYARSNEIAAHYQQVKKGAAASPHTVAALHEYIRACERVIEKNTRTIAHYEERKKILSQREDNPENASEKTPQDLARQKNTVIARMAACYSKKEELASFGANPNEIAILMSELKHLEDLYRSLNTQLGYSADETEKELKDLLKKNKELVDTTIAQRKANTDTYEYRNLMRMKEDQLYYRRINEEKKSPLFRANADTPYKYTWQKKAKKSKTHLPGEPE